jgi:hypothetical protein
MIFQMFSPLCSFIVITERRATQAFVRYAFWTIDFSEIDRATYITADLNTSSATKEAMIFCAFFHLYCLGCNSAALWLFSPKCCALTSAGKKGQARARSCAPQQRLYFLGVRSAIVGVYRLHHIVQISWQSGSHPRTAAPRDSCSDSYCSERCSVNVARAGTPYNNKKRKRYFKVRG